jgi:hypothetical protein
MPSRCSRTGRPGPVTVALLGLLIAAAGCSGDQTETPVPRRDERLLERARELRAKRAGRRSGTEQCETKRRFHRDSDGDGFGDPRASVLACAPPAGYVENAHDCYDRNALAHPGQKDHFAVHRGDGSFDYDCDGTETRRYTSRAYCRVKETGNGCVHASGWEGKGPIPRCGEPAEFSWKHCRESVVVKAPETEGGEEMAAHSEGALVPGARQSTLYECGGRTLPWKKRQLCR